MLRGLLQARLQEALVQLTFRRQVIKVLTGHLAADRIGIRQIQLVQKARQRRAHILARQVHHGNVGHGVKRHGVVQERAQLLLQRGGVAHVLKRPAHGLARHVQVLHNGLLMLFQELFVHNGCGGDGLTARVGEGAVPLNRQVDGNIQRVDQDLRQRNERLRQNGHAPVLLLHHVEHLKRAGFELQVERALETIFRQQRLNGVLRRAALAVAVYGAAAQVVERGNGSVVGHDVQHAQVVHADDLVAVFQLGVVVQNGADVAGQRANVVVAFVEQSGQAHVVHAVGLEREVVERFARLSSHDELRQAHRRRSHDKPHAHVARIGAAHKLTRFDVRGERNAIACIAAARSYAALRAFARRTSAQAKRRKRRHARKRGEAAPRHQEVSHICPPFTRKGFDGSNTWKTSQCMRPD